MGEIYTGGAVRTVTLKPVASNAAFVRTHSRRSMFPSPH